MAIEFFSSVDLNENQLQNVVIHPLSGAPSTGTEGQLYYDTGDNVVYVNTSTDSSSPTWVSMGGDITGVTAGAGISGGGSSGAVTLTLDISDGSLGTMTGIDDADLLAFSDESDTSNNEPTKNITFSNFYNTIFSKVSGDATIAAGGTLTIANDAVESGMLNDNVISGQTELAANGIAAADELLISDGGVLKKIGVDNFATDLPGLLAAGTIDVSSDHIVFLDNGATGDAQTEAFSDVVTEMAGSGLGASSGVLAVNVDDSSIEINSDTLRVKASGITNAMLAGSITNGNLSNSAITIGGTSVSLGGSITALTALTDLDLTSGNKTIFDGVGSATLTMGASGTTITIPGNLEVTGTTTYSNETVKVVADNTLQFEGASGSGAGDELNLTTGVLDADHTVTMANLSGHVALFAAAPTATISATPAELNILDGVTATASELNLVDGCDGGTIVNSKAVIYGTSGEVNATTLQIGGTSITSTAAELNILDGVTATTSELNIMDGVTATTAEINLIDGDTARGTTAVADGDGLLVNDGGTMRMTKVETVATYFGEEIASQRTIKSTITAAGTGNLNDSTNKRATINHALGTYDVMVEMYLNTDATFRSTIYAEVTRTSDGSTASDNHITIDFGNDIPADIIVLITDCSNATTKTVAYS
mgnify:CR=1 FL=1